MRLPLPKSRALEAPRHKHFILNSVLTSGCTTATLKHATLGHYPKLTTPGGSELRARSKQQIGEGQRMIITVSSLCSIRTLGDSGLCLQCEAPASRHVRVRVNSAAALRRRTPGRLPHSQVRCSHYVGQFVGALPTCHQIVEARMSWSSVYCAHHPDSCHPGREDLGRFCWWGALLTVSASRVDKIYLSSLRMFISSKRSLFASS